jgi:hypothetical protein
MLGANEFLAQIIPLFIQLVGIPIALGVAYFVYQNYYKPRNNQTNAPEQTSNTIDPISQTANVQTQNTITNFPDLEVIVESDMFHDTEVKSMTENNLPPEQEKPVTRSKRIDTSELPPLDMLIGKLEDDPIDESAPVSIPDGPPQIVELRKASSETEYVQLNTGQIAPTEEVITILRDQDDGKLVIQVGNTAYRTFADNSDVKQLFTQVMKELASTITKPDSTPPARNRYVVGDPIAAQSKPKQEQPAESSVPSIRDLLVSDDEPTQVKPAPQPRPKSKPTAPPPPPQPGGVMPGDLPSYKLDDNPIKPEKKGRFRGQKIEAEPIPEFDLATAIETYLQYKLQHTPDYAGRNIHIHGTPTGAIRVQVDADYYDFVDEVADIEVREFLQSTIAEWQDRQ